MPTKYDKMSPKSVRSTLGTGGSLDSSSLLPLQKSLAADVNELARVVNNVYDVLYSFNSTTGGLVRTTDTRFDSEPDFTGSVGIKPADIGIEGRNIYVYTANNDTTYSSPDFDALDPLFWYQDGEGNRRPNTVYETFQEFKTYIDSEIENLQITTASTAAEACITSCSYTKGFVGSVAFDSTASALGEVNSIVDKANKALFRLDQLILDVFEPSYSYGDHRSGSSAAAIRSCTLEDKIDALMLIHGVADVCDTGSIAHTGLVDQWTDGGAHIYPTAGSSKAVVVGNTTLGYGAMFEVTGEAYFVPDDGDFTIAPPNAAVDANANAFLFNGGAGGNASAVAGGDGSYVYFTCGDGGDGDATYAAGDGGPVDLLGGGGGNAANNTGGIGGYIQLLGGGGGNSTAGAFAGGRGGHIVLLAGPGGTSFAGTQGVGGDIQIAGGAHTTTGTGGNVRLRGGNSTSGTDGDVVVGDVNTSYILFGKAVQSHAKFMELDGAFYFDYTSGDSTLLASTAANETDGSDFTLTGGDGGETVGVAAGGDGGSLSLTAGNAYGGSSFTQGGQAAGDGGHITLTSGEGGWGSYLAAVTATVGRAGGTISLIAGDGGWGGISTGDGGQNAGAGGPIVITAGMGGGTFDSIVAALGGAITMTGGKGGDGQDGTLYPWGAGGADDGVGSDGGPVTIAGGDGGASQAVTVANGGAVTVIGGSGGYLDGSPRSVTTFGDIAPASAIDGGDGGDANLTGGPASWHNSHASALTGVGGDVNITGGVGLGSYASQLESYGGDVNITGGSITADTTGGIQSVGGIAGDVIINGGAGVTSNGNVYIGNVATPQIVLGNARVTCNGPIEIAAQDSAVSTQYASLSWASGSPTVGYLWADPDVNFIEIETWPAADPVLGISALVLPTEAVQKKGHIYIIKVYDDSGSGIIYPEANLFGPGITESFDGPGRYTDNNLMEISGAGTYEFISNGTYWVIRNLYIIGTYS